MRKILRRITKAKMAKDGVTKVNRKMAYGVWRQVVNAYPVNIQTGKPMGKYQKGHRGPFFAY